MPTLSPSSARVLLVTGAASGIGAAVVRRLAAPGTGLLLHTRSNEVGLSAVAQAARAAGAPVETALGDLADPALPAALVDIAVGRFGGLGGLIHVAGFADPTPLAALSDAALEHSLAAILGSFARLARAAAPHLRAAGDARVIAVSSFVAHAFRPDLPVFAASAAAKAGLEALVRALAIELAPSVCVNAVVPGFIRKDEGAAAALDPARTAAQTGRIPLARLGTPDDVAAAIAFLAGPGGSYITGQALRVDGGLVI